MEKPFNASSYDISINNSKPTVKRKFEFNGDSVEFSVTLEADNSATLPNLHVRSVEVVIAHLQTLIPQK